MTGTPAHPTTAEIEALIEFLRSELDERISMGVRLYVSGHRSALAIAERLPALVAEIERVKDSETALSNDVEELITERDYADTALRNIGMALGTTDEWTDQATMIADVEGRVARLSRENAAMREALKKISAIDQHRYGQNSEDGGEWPGPFANIASAALAQLDAPPAEEASQDGDALCKFCGRHRYVPCMNTRDMSPIDGDNNDPTCHLALKAAGGGERRETGSAEPTRPVTDEEVGRAYCTFEDIKRSRLEFGGMRAALEDFAKRRG